ncbi:MAG TPA: ATP-binding protein [Xanthobacteraceae bacterium]
MHRKWQLSIASQCLHTQLGGILLAAVIWLGLPFECAATPADQPPAPSILIINQSDSYHPWPNTIIAEIRSAVRANIGPQISIYTEHLDVYQFTGLAYEESLSNYFREKYHDKLVGIVVVIGPAALELALRVRPSLWPAAAIVFCSVDEQTAARQFPPGVTGTIMRVTFSDMVKAARILLPNVRQFAIVGDRPESQLYYRNFAHEVSMRLQDPRFLDLMGLSLTEVTHRVAALPDHTAILYIGINSDQSGRYVAADLIAPIVQAANRPTIVNAETFLGSGAVGGFILSPGRIGRETSQIATRILAGEDTSSIPITIGGPPKPIFDWRALQRWNISERLLPPGSEVRYRIPGVWEQYRMGILAAGAVVLLQAALIALLIYERRHRHAAEVTARVTMSELTRMDRVATAGELSASIAHEVSQPLAGIALRAGAALRWLGRQPPDLGKVRSALEQIVSASHHTGDIVKGIRAMFKKDTQVSGRVDINEVIVLVLQLTRVELRKHDIDVRTQLTMFLPPVVGDAVQLQQVILNLVMNAIEAMHSSSRRILRIKSELDKSRSVHVSVEDTGTGIDPSSLDRVFKPLYTTKATGMGMGLTICHSIIARHDGRIWVSAGSDGGSAFQFIVPTMSARAGSATHEKAMP